MYSVRGAEQQYLLKAIGVLLVKYMNEKIKATADLKFRNIQKLTEIKQQITDIGKELAFHAREQVLTDVIEQQRQRLFKQYRESGVAVEECAERAAKNCLNTLGQFEDQVKAECVKLLPLDLLNVETLPGLREEQKKPEFGQTTQKILKQLSKPGQMQTLSEKPDPRCLTDQGLFMVCDAGAYLKSTKDEVLGLQK